MASLIAQSVKNPPAMQESPVQFLGWKDLLEKWYVPTVVFLGFPGGSTGKKSACNVGVLGLIPGLGRSPGEGKGYTLQYSGLENSMNCIVHGVAKSWTWPSNFTWRYWRQASQWDLLCSLMWRHKRIASSFHTAYLIFLSNWFFNLFKLVSF